MTAHLSHRPCSENSCAELRAEAANQRAESACRLQGLRVELEAQREALRGRLEEVERQQERERAGERVQVLEGGASSPL